MNAFEDPGGPPTGKPAGGAALDVCSFQLPKMCSFRLPLTEGGVSGLVPRSSRPLRHAGRQWTMADAERVLGVRRTMPWAGKARVTVELARRHPRRALSTATVGRILAWGVAARRVRPRSFCEGAGPDGAAAGFRALARQARGRGTTGTAACRRTT